MTKSATPEYACWAALKQRCYNPNHPRHGAWGGRGIKVCERWLNSFDNFLADMGPRPTPFHSIERQDNDGDYEPSNCTWATTAAQAKNKRPRGVNRPKIPGSETASLIDFFGGALRFSKAIGVQPSSVSRWARDGDGTIPLRYKLKALKVAIASKRPIGPLLDALHLLNCPVCGNALTKKQVAQLATQEVDLPE